MRRISPEAAAILHAVADRHQDAQTAPAPRAEWQRIELAEAIEFGPRVALSQWFGCRCGSAVHARYRRALTRLADGGLIVMSRADGAKASNAKLTPAGELLLDQISQARAA